MSRADWLAAGYAVTSWGNGTAYTVVSPDGTRDFFLQGEDASAWRDDFDFADAHDDMARFMADSMADYGSPIEA